MTIGVDIDETITNSQENIKKYLKLYDESYEDYHDLPWDKYQEFLAKYLDKIILSHTLKEGVKEAFAYFHKKGYKVIIITARANNYNPKVVKATLKYLKKHKLKYDKIIFAKEDNELKGPKAYQENVDIFIDDKESVLDDMQRFKIKGIRFTKEYSKYLAFNNWFDIIDYFKKEEKNNG